MKIPRFLPPVAIGPDSRSTRTALLLWLLLPGLLCAEMGVAPWCSHHAVLQRPGADTREEDLLLWGWMDKGDTVTVSFGEPATDIVADRKDFPGERDLKRWEIPYGKLKRKQLPSGPFRLTVKSRKYPQTIERTNVVLGDVWVFGQKPEHGVPIPSERLAALSGGLGHRLRYLEARSLNWTNEPAPAGAGWKPWDSAAASLTANVACYFGCLLATNNAGVPVGLVLVHCDKVFGIQPDKPGEAVRAPDVERAWDSARQAGTLAEGDCAPLFQRYQEQIVQLKREGKVLAPPAQPIERPFRVHLGAIPSMACPIRGAIW
jgi:hypothetical protein